MPSYSYLISDILLCYIMCRERHNTRKVKRKPPQIKQFQSSWYTKFRQFQSKALPHYHTPRGCNRFIIFTSSTTTTPTLLTPKTCTFVILMVVGPVSIAVPYHFTSDFLVLSMVTFIPRILQLYSSNII